MRLLDSIGQVTRPLTLRDASGKVREITGLCGMADRMSTFPLRYVLNEPASAQCRDLMVFAHEMFHADDPFLRVPAQRFWIEWFCDFDETSRLRDATSAVRMSGSRMGAAVVADESGRRGEIQHFFDSHDGPVRERASLYFDLDRELPIPRGIKTTFRLTHAELHHLNPLFRHVVITIDPEWQFMTSWPTADFQRAVARIADAAWCCLPIILSFSAMLNSGGILNEQKSDLTRLNTARMKRGRIPLLDHVEVGTTLGYSRFSEGSGTLDARQAPRLHFVRGHIVRRGAHTFWRASHLRGDVTKPVRPRTIRFDAHECRGNGNTPTEG